MAAMEELGLGERAGRFPDELSGGERQRVAIARAVVGDRHLLLADEPSGALDSANGEAVMRLIRAACQRGVAGVVVTHDAQLASWADRVVFLRDGRVVDQTSPPPGPESLLAPSGHAMTTAVLERPLVVRGSGDGGRPARRAVVRWAWRMFRREWRRQALVLALLTVAVAATTVGLAIVSNAAELHADPTFGTANTIITSQGSGCRADRRHRRGSRAGFGPSTSSPTRPSRCPVRSPPSTCGPPTPTGRYVGVTAAPRRRPLPDRSRSGRGDQRRRQDLRPARREQSGTRTAATLAGRRAGREPA